MHPRVLSEGAWRTVRALSGGGWLDSWTLAGGTGLALHLGHRYSEDLDLFGLDSFDPPSLAEALSSVGQVRVQQSAADTLHAEVNGLRVSFLRAQTPFLFPPSVYRGLTVADPRDIAVLKVVAIGGHGSRKDFVDLFFFLRSGGTLVETLSHLEKRYQGVDFNIYHLLKSLVYFKDAEEEPFPRMIKSVEWDEVRRSIIAEVRRLS